MNPINCGAVESEGDQLKNQNHAVEVSSEGAITPYFQRIFNNTKSLGDFIVSEFLTRHLLINLFYVKSLVYPIYMRLTEFVFLLALTFGFSAVLYTDNMIEARNIYQLVEGGSVGFAYVFREEFDRCFLSCLIPLLIMYCIKLINHPSDKDLKTFSTILKNEE